MKIGIDIGALLQERYNDVLNETMIKSCNDGRLDPKEQKLLLNSAINTICMV